MSDLQEQLAILRKRIARVDAKFAKTAAKPQPVPAPPVDDERKPMRYFVEEWLTGQAVETPAGQHFETERIWERHRRHGTMDISTLQELPEDLLDAISEGQHSPSSCCRWAFLDTETTGLAGGSGTYAFLVGVGRITEEGFHLKQFFMRDLGEEASLLYGLGEYLGQFDTLITYNGKTYDEPLLLTRYRMQRTRPPFARLHHLDLLHGSRRLWKMRMDSCRLVELERQILGVERTGDLPGDMIPYVYFEYLKTREAWRVAPILHHNAIDILTLACLTGIVPWVYRSPEEAKLAHGTEMVGVARWLKQGGRMEDALTLFRRAVKKGLPDDLVFRTLWDIAAIERKLEREGAAIAVYTELAQCRNAFRLPALQELAKYYEHRERNWPMALEFTLSALQLENSEPLQRRKARLERKLAGGRNRRLI